MGLPEGWSFSSNYESFNEADKENLNKTLKMQELSLVAAYFEKNNFPFQLSYDLSKIY